MSPKDTLTPNVTAWPRDAQRLAALAHHLGLDQVDALTAALNIAEKAMIPPDRRNPTPSTERG